MVAPLLASASASSAHPKDPLPLAQAGPAATFLHSQAQQFPAISSDGSSSDSDGRAAPFDSDSLRGLFASRMSRMYRDEVPLYGTLLSIVADVNARKVAAGMAVSDEEMSRLNVERHGAIRVGTPAELALLARIFRVFGMRPVGYYDLWTDSGLPIHSTAFRPVGSAELMKNPFRIFCSLLRLELIADPETRQLAQRLLAERRIASARCVELLTKLEGAISGKGGAHLLHVPRDEALEFIDEVVQIFKWHADTSVSKADYDRLKSAHPLVADIVSFRGPHINHLTPRTLDIDEVQREMVRRGIDAKDVIEGPPARTVPIYLRQTSFHALSESVVFAGSSRVSGTHKARFGEIEARGQALTRAGAKKYDELFREFSALVRSQGGVKAVGEETYYSLLRETFSSFSENESDMRTRGLGYFSYRVATPGADAGGRGLEQLIADGTVVAEPIVFEDFLPASAAGIFQSNLPTESKLQPASGAAAVTSAGSGRREIEEAVACALLDPFELYQTQSDESLAQVARELGLASAEELVSARPSPCA